MTHLISIHFSDDLYEVRYSGTVITSIQKWHGGGNTYRMINFQNLPKEVQDNIITQMRKNQKK